MSPAALYAATLVGAVALTGASVWQVQDWRYGARIDAAALEDAQSRARAATQVAAAEQALRDRNHHQEVLDDRNQKTTAALSTRLRSATTAAGRLRDPHAAVCPAGAPQAAAPAGAGAEHPAEAVGLFSGPASALFLRLTRESDEINDAYASCRADGESVRQ